MASSVGRLVGRAWKAVVIVATIVTLLGIYTLWPHVSIAPPTESDPLLLRYVVTNASAFALRSVKTTCGVQNIEFANGSSISGIGVEIVQPKESSAQSTVSNRHAVPQIAAGEAHTFTCEDVVASGLPITRGSVSLNVEYSYCYIPLHAEACFNLWFDGQRTRWLPAACSK